jgi:hypothetical protein
VAKGSIRITKAEWRELGGFANPLLWRRQAANGRWTHYKRID